MSRPLLLRDIEGPRDTGGCCCRIAGIVSASSRTPDWLESSARRQLQLESGKKNLFGTSVVHEVHIGSSSLNIATICNCSGVDVRKGVQQALLVQNAIIAFSRLLS